MILSHTDKHYEEELIKLKDAILKMGGIVENMIARALKALLERNSDLAKEVMQKEPEVNRMEVETDEKCIQMLALRQPAASDLRFIIIGLRISKDLERMADLAVDICQQTVELNKLPKFKSYGDLEAIGTKTQVMVKNSLDSFVERDADKANKVCLMDDEVDHLKHQVFLDMAEVMEKKPNLVGRCLHFILISRHFERIADHATNIAEEVIFMVKGEDIRHKGDHKSLYMDDEE